MSTRNKERNQEAIFYENEKALLLRLSGRLETQTLNPIWDYCTNFLKEKRPAHLIIDCKAIDYCDSAGFSLIQTLVELQIQKKRTYIIENMDPSVAALLKTIETNTKHTLYHPPLPKRQFASQVGEYAVNIVRNIKENVAFLGEFFCWLIKLLFSPSQFRWKEMWQIAQETGPHALPLIAMIGFLIGFISAFQAAIPLGRFGAQIYIANLVAISLVREMAPLMTAVIIAGRTASAFAAELGTMKINQELDALTTMGLSPVRFFVIPRMVAASIMTPLLNIFLIFFGLVGCGVVMRALGFNPYIFLHQVQKTVHLSDFIGGTIKACVFGIVIAGIGCMHGLKTKLGARAVGHSTTQAVVMGIIFIIIIDGIFAYIYYMLGI